MTNKKKFWGPPLKAKTKGQINYIRSIVENEIIFCQGPSGSGKSFVALGLATQYLIDGKYNHIVVLRPSIEASERGLGYVKGSLTEKLEPFASPAIEHLKYFLGDYYRENLENGNIKYEALEYCRGKTFDKSFILLDEAQNCTKSQLIMVVTRIGESSKLVICGDPFQYDLKSQTSDFPTDFEYVIHKVKSANLPNFSICELGESDIVRNPNIAPFLRLFK